VSLQLTYDRFPRITLGQREAAPDAIDIRQTRAMLACGDELVVIVRDKHDIVELINDIAHRRGDDRSTGGHIFQSLCRIDEPSRLIQCERHQTNREAFRVRWQLSVVAPA